MRKPIVLALFVVGLSGGLAAAAPMSWDQADAFCKTSANGGPGCCAVAGDDGYPKIRGDGPVCTCGELIVNGGKPLSVKERRKLARLYGERLPAARQSVPAAPR